MTTKLHGLHHITAITGDAQANVDFYAGLLGLRLIKKTVNFDAPDVYHLYYGDERGRPGGVLTFFEFPGVVEGRAGAGMVHRIAWRVPSDAALSFWEDRLGAAGIDAARTGAGLRFADPEGLEHDLLAVESADPPLTADADGIAPEHALSGFLGVRAFSADPGASGAVLSSALGFEQADDGAWELRGEGRDAWLRYDAPPAEVGIQGAGSVHHVAWAVRDDDHLVEGRAAARREGAHTTDVIDRKYFHSVYFREPSGVLFELATEGPGFGVDEPFESLGESLTLPERYEPLRERLELTLAPLHNPRSAPSRP
jgi:glyoxalase family protein